MTYHGGLATHKILILAPLAYNLSPTTPPVFSLPDHALVTLEGPDAMAFAHAQFANDVAALAPGCWQWNAWLTPKGRVIAVFALARPAEDRVWLVLPDHPADLFAEAPLHVTTLAWAASTLACCAFVNLMPSVLVWVAMLSAANFISRRSERRAPASRCCFICSFVMTPSPAANHPR